LFDFFDFKYGFQHPNTLIHLTLSYGFFIPEFRLENWAYPKRKLWFPCRTLVCKAFDGPARTAPTESPPSRPPPRSPTELFPTNGITHRNFQGLTFFLTYSIFSAVLGMLQFGYNTGVINAPEKNIENFMKDVYKDRYGEDISEEFIQQLYSVAVSIFAIGGMLGGFSGGWMANRFGRLVE